MRRITDFYSLLRPVRHLCNFKTEVRLKTFRINQLNFKKLRHLRHKLHRLLRNPSSAPSSASPNFEFMAASFPQAERKEPHKNFKLDYFASGASRRCFNRDSRSWKRFISITFCRRAARSDASRFELLSAANNKFCNLIPDSSDFRLRHMKTFSEHY